jgi:hypothetical protein
MLFMTMIVLAIVALTGGLAAARGGGDIYAGSAAAIWVAEVVGLCAQSTTFLGSLAPQMPVFENRSPAPLASPAPAPSSMHQARVRIELHKTRNRGEPPVDGCPSL